MPRRYTRKKQTRRRKRKGKTRTKKGSGVTSSKSVKTALLAAAAMSATTPISYGNMNPYTRFDPFHQQHFVNNPGSMIVHTDPYIEGIQNLIGNIRQTPKSNVYISDKKVLKTYDDFNEFEENKTRAINASVNNYGPKFYNSGQLTNGKYYIITKKLNTLKDINKLSASEQKNFHKQLSAGLKNMHKIGKHTHSDIHIGNVLYDDTGDGRKYVWNDFDYGQKVANSKQRRKLQLKSELRLLEGIRPHQINL